MRTITKGGWTKRGGQSQIEEEEEEEDFLHNVTAKNKSESFKTR